MLLPFSCFLFVDTFSMHIRTIVPTVALTLSLAGPVDASTVVDSQTKSLRHLASLGGDLSTPVKLDNFVYVPTGAMITAWDYTNPQAPRISGDTRKNPSRGVIAGIALYGSYLYAGWNHNGPGGIAIYSLADPSRPRLIREIESGPGFGLSAISGVAVVGKWLYVFDESGMHVNVLDDPENPKPIGRGTGLPAYADVINVSGNYLTAAGRSMLGQTSLSVYDIGNPAAPVQTTSTTLHGELNFSLQFAWPRAVGFGYAITSYQMQPDAPPIQVDSVPAQETMYDGFVVGDFAYSLGSPGIGVWDVASKIRHVGNAAFDDAFAAKETYAQGARVWVVGVTDRLTNIDVQQPTSPQLVSNVTTTASESARDAAVVRGKLVFLQETYGATVVRHDDFLPLARFDVSLPKDFQSRAFTDWSVNGPLVHMLSWGTGFVTVDFSNPLRPREIGRFAASHFSAISVAGRYAFLGKTTNGGEIASIDLSVPDRPVQIGSLAVDSGVWRLQQRGTKLFAATGGSPAAPGGLRIFDVSNPGVPVLAGSYRDDCISATDLALSEDGKVVYLRCETGLHVIDASRPVAPVRVGLYASKTSGPSSVALAHGRAFIDEIGYIAEIDVRNPSVPKLVSRQSIPMAARRLTVSDGRLYAFTGHGGTQVFSLARPGFGD
jgi:hypothetical protein